MPREKILNILATEVEGQKDELVFRFDGEEFDRVHVPDLLNNALSQLPEVQQIVGKNYNRGHSRSTLNIDHLGTALVLKTLASDAETAVKSLYDFFAQEIVPSIEIIQLGGLEVSETFEVAPGIFISKLDDAPSDTLKEVILKNSAKPQIPDIHRQNPADYTEPTRKPTAALYRLTEIKPKFLSMDSKESMAFDVGDLQLLMRISELLTLIGPSSPVIRRRFIELQRGSFLFGVMGRTTHVPYEETRVENSYLASSGELEDFKSILAAYLVLSEKRQNELAVPLHRLNEAIRHKNHVDKAIDLGVALEALLLDGNKEQQLTLQLRLRGAWLLGKNLEDRKQISKLLRDIYALRSSAAHTGKISEKEKSEADVELLLQRGIALCALAIRTLIMSKPDWNDLVLGG